MTFLLLFVFWQAAKPEIRIPDLEQQIVQAVNLQRRAADLEALEIDGKLSDFARAHSEDMVQRNYFRHENPEGQTPMKRLLAAGNDKCRLLGENIYQNNLYSRVITEKKRTTYDWNTMEQISETTVRGWMASEGHRKAMLDANYKTTGVGVAISSDDKVYITQLFCSS
jgi:uncharacterized protein YkwD